jgi:hypothetical protein
VTVAYVPDLANDLFLSYAHADDPKWIRAFEQGLREAVRRRLGLDIAVWQDTGELRLGQNWREEIENAIARTAAMVLVLSPSYESSKWCYRERKHFLDQFPEGKVPSAGTIHRLLKVVKLPWHENRHLRFLGELQHIDFYRDDGKAALEFPPGSDDFRRKVAEAAESIAALLRAMRRQKERVYVATPAQDCFEHWEGLRNELLRQGFDVQPDGPRDAAFEDSVLRAEMNGSVLSVHMFGACYDPFSAHQVGLATDLGNRLLVWVPKEEWPRAHEKQKVLVEGLRQGRAPDGRELPPGFVILDGDYRASLVPEVLAVLKPRPAEASTAAAPGAAPKVYLLCDPTSGDDAAFARQLRAAMVRREGALEVELPEANLSSPSALRQRHVDRLRTCDGLLLFRQAAPDEWFMQNFADLMFAERLLKRTPIRSKAVLLDDTAALEGQTQGVRLIPRTPNFSIEDLEPFLAPLRMGGPVDARP